MSKKTISNLTALLVLLFSSQQLVAETENPEFESWNRFGVGTWIKQETTTDAQGNVSKMVQTTKLVSKDASKLTLEMTMEMHVAGNTVAMPPQTREVLRKGPSAAAVTNQVAPSAKVTDGTDKVKLKAKSYDCQWIETTFSAAGIESVSKVWQTDDIPGGMIKMTSQTKGAASSETDMKTLDFEIVK